MKKITMFIATVLLAGATAQAQRVTSFEIEEVRSLGPAAFFTPVSNVGSGEIVYPANVDLSNVTAKFGYSGTMVTDPLPTDYTQTQRVELQNTSITNYYDIICKRINPTALPYELPVGAGFSNSWTSATEGWAAARIARNQSFARFDMTNTNLIIAFTDVPDILTYDIYAVGNPTQANDIFDVEQSEDGTTWTPIAQYTGENTLLGGSNNKRSELFPLNSATRYVRFLYTNRANVNIVVSAVSITKAASLPEPTAVMSITAGQAIQYPADALSSTVQQLTVTGTSDNATINHLLAALGSNQDITSIRFDALANDVASNDFTGINPNCLKYLPAETISAPEGWTNVVAGTTAITPITIVDGSPFITLGDITNANVTYTRDCYMDGGWETIILPFAVSTFPSFADYTIEAYNGGKGTGTIQFTTLNSVTDWEANTAYILSYKQGTGNVNDVQSCTFSNAGTTINTTPSSAEFTGVYRQVPGKVEGVNKYILDADGSALYKGSDQSTVPAFRAYYLPTNQQNTPARFSVEHEGGATNIHTESTINSIYSIDGILYIHTTAAITVDVYHIDGRKIMSESLAEGVNTISSLARGIYVVNKVKVVI